jgi:hypothetical protein
MTAPTTPPRTPGWPTVLLALLAFVAVPLLPTALQVVLPVTLTVLMVVALIAVCGLIGWWKGGSGLFAVLWLGVAVVMMVPLMMTPLVLFVEHGSLVFTIGWVLLLGAAFGIASLLSPWQAFFRRALSAVGIAMVAAFAMVIMVPDGVATVRAMMTAEYSDRTEWVIAVVNRLVNTAEKMTADFDRQVNTPEGRAMIKKHSALDSLSTLRMKQSESQLRSFAKQAATLVPAFLALESLAALALAWVVYHRIASTPIGPALGAWRDFRFNDQLIWGLAVGATIAFLPAFADGKNAGLNLLLFFGTLYLLRGVGVLSWVTRGRGAMAILIIATAFAPVSIAALALGVGVGDTWMDWRSRIASAT